MPDDIDTGTLRRLDSLQEEHRCRTCGKRPRLQQRLTKDWIETGEVEVHVVKSCECPT